MKSKKRKIGFIGTMQIASFFLDQILKNEEFELEFVITKSDSNKERSDLSHYLSNFNHNLKVYRPKSILKVDPNIFYGLEAVILIAYGEKIPDYLLKITKWINIHGSILPSLRGASPIQYAIDLDFKKTGISVILMDEEIDRGNIIGTKEIEIRSNDTFGSLSCRMGLEMAPWFVQILTDFLNNKILPKKQDEYLVTKAPIIKRKFRNLDWSLPAEMLERRVRALNPSPYALANVGDLKFKVVESEVIFEDFPVEIGEIVPGKRLIIKTSKHSLNITKLIPNGKRCMTGEEFLRGFRR